MNKIGRWYKTKKMLPVINKPILADLGDSTYKVMRLYSIEGTMVTFMTDAMHDAESCSSKDIKRWAYIKLEKY